MIRYFLKLLPRCSVGKESDEKGVSADLARPDSASDRGSSKGFQQEVLEDQ